MMKILSNYEAFLENKNFNNRQKNKWEHTTGQDLDKINLCELHCCSTILYCVCMYGEMHWKASLVELLYYHESHWSSSCFVHHIKSNIIELCGNNLWNPMHKRSVTDFRFWLLFIRLFAREVLLVKKLKI